MGNVVRLRDEAIVIAPVTVNRNVVPTRRRNADLRTREHLTPEEMERLIAAAKKVGRHGHRDSTLLLVAYRHGLRVSELVDLRWDQVDFTSALLHVRRLKNGTPSSQPITGGELRALRRVRREQKPASPFMFTTERGGPITDHTVRKLVQRAGQLAGLGDYVHPHQLRHSAGYKLAADGVDTRTIQGYLGHKNIQHTTVYTALSPNRFNGLWKD